MASRFCHPCFGPLSMRPLADRLSSIVNRSLRHRLEMRNALKRCFVSFSAPNVTTGISPALGCLLIAASMFFSLFGPLAASVRTSGRYVLYSTGTAPPHGANKGFSLPPAPLRCWLPLFACRAELHETSPYSSVCCWFAYFRAFLAGAWGKQGYPIVISIMSP